jgi:hypothetical protein
MLQQWCLQITGGNRERCELEAAKRDPKDIFMGAAPFVSMYIASHVILLTFRGCRTRRTHHEYGDLRKASFFANSSEAVCHGPVALMSWVQY